jgi:ADP-heptose:LPS heptosyltransferase
MLKYYPLKMYLKWVSKHPYSKDVREIGALMANTEVFIGGDSGIMHLASASKVSTVGLFPR